MTSPCCGTVWQSPLTVTTLSVTDPLQLWLRPHFLASDRAVKSHRKPWKRAPSREIAPRAVWSRQKWRCLHFLPFSLSCFAQTKGKLVFKFSNFFLKNKLQMVQMCKNTSDRLKMNVVRTNLCVICPPSWLFQGNIEFEVIGMVFVYKCKMLPLREICESTLCIGSIIVANSYKIQNATWINVKCKVEQ